MIFREMRTHIIDAHIPFTMIKEMGSGLAPTPPLQYKGNQLSKKPSRFYILSNLKTLSGSFFCTKRVHTSSCNHFLRPPRGPIFSHISSRHQLHKSTSKILMHLFPTSPGSQIIVMKRDYNDRTRLIPLQLIDVFCSIPASQPNY